MEVVKTFIVFEKWNLLLLLLKQCVHLINNDRDAEKYEYIDKESI